MNTDSKLSGMTLRSVHCQRVLWLFSLLLAFAGPVWATDQVQSVAAPANTGAHRPAERSWPCPPDAAYSQPSDGCNDSWSAFTSAIAPDGSFEYTVFENFPVIGSDICAVHFYGLSLLWNNGWFPCDPAGMVFEIIFYAPGNLPTPIVAGPYTVTPGRTLLETCFGVYDLYYFEASWFRWCASTTDGGWVSIKSISAPNNCVFLWMTAPTTYDGQSYQLNAGTYSPLGRDLALCLPACCAPYSGACCDDYSATCTDNVEMLDCLTQGRRFQGNVLCAQMTPPCGQGSGACCYDNGLCCLTSLWACTLIGDLNYDGVIDFDDINPFVDVLSAGEYNCQADINGDGVVDFDDINPFVDVISGAPSPGTGSFLGIGTTCDQCPCIVRCPEGASDEGEPCLTDTNGGCNMAVPTFELLPECPVTVCGTAWFDGGLRDTDWYQLDLSVPSIVTVTGVGEVNNMVFGWLEQYVPGLPGCGNITGYLNPYFVAAECVAGIYTTACMPAGTYYLFAATDFSMIDPCPVDYVMTVTLTACTPPQGACCVNETCIGNMDRPQCANQGGMWYPGQSCATFYCPCCVANDLCTDAQEVDGPYPQTVLGTCVGATVDCPDVLGWTAVWYKVQLPYASNHVDITYCGDTIGFGTVGIVYYNMCDDCPNYVLATSYVWNSCSAGGAYGIEMWWSGVAGPASIWVPAYCIGSDGLPMAFHATFNVTPGPATPEPPQLPAPNNSAKANVFEVQHAPKVSR